MFIQKSYLSPTFFKLNVLFALKCSIVADFSRVAAGGGSSSTNRLSLWIFAIHRMASKKTRIAKAITAFRFDLRNIFFPFAFAVGCVLHELVPQQPTFLYDDFISNISQIANIQRRFHLPAVWSPQKKHAKEKSYAVFSRAQGSHTHRLSTFFPLNFCNTFELNRFQNTSSNRINRTQFVLMLLLFSFACSICFFSADSFIFHTFRLCKQCSYIAI